MVSQSCVILSSYRLNHGTGGLSCDIFIHNISKHKIIVRAIAFDLLTIFAWKMDRFHFQFLLLLLRCKQFSPQLTIYFIETVASAVHTNTPLQFNSV